MKNRILIVEDDPAKSKVIVTSLTAAGYLCVRAFDGKEALQAIQEQSFDLALTIILLSVSACLYFFTAVQTESLLHQAEESGEQTLTAFCEHLSTLKKTGNVNERTDSITRNALIQYTFSTYAHLLQNEHQAYSLANGAEYLYNTAPSDPAAMLPMNETALRGSRTIRLNGVPISSRA